MLNVGDNVIINKNLKRGKIVGKQIKKYGCVFEVQLSGSTKSFIYIEKQLSKRP